MEILPTQHPRALERALSFITREKAIVFPTDTVYGLGASPFSKRAIERLYEIKGRSHEKAIPVLIGDLGQLPLVTHEFPVCAQKLARKFWPGALTLIVAKNPALPADLFPLPTIGVRMPDHEFAIALLKACGPLATTSANLSGEREASTLANVLDQLQAGPDLILDGGVTPGGVPSTVVDCTVSPVRILREGPIRAEDIFAALDG